MKKMSFIFGFSFICLASAYSQEMQVKRENGNLYFDGKITHEAAKVLIKHLRTGVTHLYISSRGGNAEAALDIADAMQQAQALLTVTRYCYSSCANYLFLSAKQKNLNSNAILGFHGGFYQEIETKSEHPLAEKVRQLMQRDREYFYALNINRNLFKLSYELTKPDNSAEIYSVLTKRGEQVFKTQKEAIQVYESLKRSGEFAELTINIRDISEAKLYFPSEQTLRKFGVTGIGRYPYPKNKEAVEKLANEYEVDIVSDIEQK